MDEDELRVLVDDLLKTEADKKIVETLMQYRFDAMLEGTEAEKNAALSPALAVPDIDKRSPPRTRKTEWAWRRLRRSGPRQNLRPSLLNGYRVLLQHPNGAQHKTN